MAQYSQRDIIAMQQDAIRRVQEMQRRAEEKVSTPSADSANTADLTPKNKSGQPNDETADKEVAGISDTNGSLFGSLRSFLPSSLQNAFDMDSDAILLILLILFLQHEGSDSILILALLYLML